jgi:hypothetical protein
LNASEDNCPKKEPLASAPGAIKSSASSTRRNPVEALVEEELKPDESVVVYPPDALKDGARVTVTKLKNP